MIYPHHVQTSNTTQHLRQTPNTRTSCPNTKHRTHPHTNPNKFTNHMPAKQLTQTRVFLNNKHCSLKTLFLTIGYCDGRLALSRQALHASSGFGPNQHTQHGQTWAPHRHPTLLEVHAMDPQGCCSQVGCTAWGASETVAMLGPYEAGQGASLHDTDQAPP